VHGRDKEVEGQAPVGQVGEVAKCGARFGAVLGRVDAVVDEDCEEGCEGVEALHRRKVLAGNIKFPSVHNECMDGSGILELKDGDCCGVARP